MFGIIRKRRELKAQEKKSQELSLETERLIKQAEEDFKKLDEMNRFYEDLYKNYDFVPKK